MKTIILTLLSSISIFAQDVLILFDDVPNPCRTCVVYDNFSDENYTGWTVVSGAFSVNNSVANPLSSNQYSLLCGTAGVIYIACAQAYGTWEFDLYKGGTANILGMAFIGDATVSQYATSGYRFGFDSGEEIAMSRRTTTSALFTTATSYISIQTWYRVKITRSGLGVFTVYIKGGTFGADYIQVSVVGGIGANPSTDNTHTTSVYFLLDIDAGDRVPNIQIYP